ncbi:Xanthine phosphoribosyltransferase 1 [Linnemannia exigua]|uniref:Xanthine phosphoribosyltransferase 1 n=1 Tax=Linnemannia exigua TaxID=604196 RepID=A0AAD4H4H8_9FUNG|nr:Xanthine phosphoribosyltransferase 1 [Linnemannia exigua]
MAPMISISSPRIWSRTYRFFSQHIKSTFFVVIVIFTFINIFSHISFDFLRSKPIPPAEPAQRRAVPELKTLRSGRPNPLVEPAPGWKARWLYDQELDLTDDATDAAAATKSREEEIARPFDIVYTWVNGTDPLLRQVKEKYKETSPLFLYFKNSSNHATPPSRYNNRLNPNHEPPMVGNRSGDQTIHRFRDNNELKYSLRSIAQYVPEEMVKRIHILTTEVPDTNNKDNRNAAGASADQGRGHKLVGQVPQWLDLSKVGDKIRLVKHREVFDDASILPSFNSLSIESQMHHIPDLADTFIYFNDDIFVGLPVGRADFWTPLYGFVFHLTSTVVDPAIPKLGTTPNIGEWQSLQYTNYLLSKQFGARHRAYISHIVHIMNVPILEEMQAIWPEEFDKTASHRFRGEGEAQEINLAYFMAHYVIERLRETQLTSFWKYRLDKDQNGNLDWSEREALIRMIEEYHATLPKELINKKRVFPSPIDPTFQSFLQGYDKKLESIGIPGSINRTSYDQSGMDGYPFMIRGVDLSRSSSSIRSFQLSSLRTDPSRRQCLFDIDFCLGPEFRNQSITTIDVSSTGEGSLFERLAFTEYHCGDCLLHIVRRSSPTPGMSTVMPLDRRSSAYAEVARDMSKYNYVIGRSQFSFVQLTTGDKSEASLRRLWGRNETDLYFCVNDDVPDSPLIAKRVRGLFTGFMDARLPFPSPWEIES